MNEPKMIVCGKCGREWNTSALKQCPGCGARSVGTMEEAASFGSAASQRTSFEGPSRSGIATPVSPRLLEHARAVESLGRTVVAFAWITGLLGVFAGLVLLVSGLNQRTGGSTLVITGIAVAVQGLVSAVFIALVGRYAQMRAVQAQSPS
ncbi:MAG: hypothetical protein AB7O74_11450 [Candidatus Nanopelagicales bacterium]